MLASVVKIKPAGRASPSTTAVDTMMLKRRGSTKRDSGIRTASALLKRSREEKILHLVSIHISAKAAGNISILLVQLLQRQTHKEVFLLKMKLMRRKAPQELTPNFSARFSES